MLHVVEPDGQLVRRRLDLLQAQHGWLLALEQVVQLGLPRADAVHVPRGDLHALKRIVGTSGVQRRRTERVDAGPGPSLGTGLCVATGPACHECVAVLVVPPRHMFDSRRFDLTGRAVTRCLDHQDTWPSRNINSACTYDSSIQARPHATTAAQGSRRGRAAHRGTVRPVERSGGGSRRSQLDRSRVPRPAVPGRCHHGRSTRRAHRAHLRGHHSGDQSPGTGGVRHPPPRREGPAPRSRRRGGDRRAPDHAVLCAAHQPDQQGERPIPRPSTRHRVALPDRRDRRDGRARGVVAVAATAVAAAVPSPDDRRGAAAAPGRARHDPNHAGRCAHGPRAARSRS